MIVLESGIGNYVYSNGKKYSYFGGNNYLGLSTHPVVKAAVIHAVEKYGVNFSASRCTTGTSDIHLEFEKQLSSFKGKEDKSFNNWCKFIRPVSSSAASSRTDSNST